eukprot:12807739-Alexandrium_andersonii.AAC.1
MSASLVGSEMCIRDRCQRAPYPEGLAIPPPPRMNAQHAGSRPRRKPVSYTHLTLPTICSV